MKLSHKQKWGKSIIDIAKDEGVSRSRIYQRIERHGTPFAEEIEKHKKPKKKYNYYTKKPKQLSFPFMGDKKKYNYYTKKPNKYIIKWGKSLADLSKEEGVTEGVIRDRIKKYGTPYKTDKYIIKWGKSLADIAKDEGVTKKTIRGRLKKHGTPFK